MRKCETKARVKKLRKIFGRLPDIRVVVLHPQTKYMRGNKKGKHITYTIVVSGQ